MPDVPVHPGYATNVALAAHWAVDRRTVPTITRDLGLVRRRPGWAWLDVWAAEGIVPKAQHHEALRAPMLDADGVAALIPTASGGARSAKTVVRWSESGRDGFPSALRLGKRLRRWREAEILAWLGENSPPFQRTSPRPMPGPAARARLTVDRSTASPSPTRLAEPVSRPLLAPRAPAFTPRDASLGVIGRIAGHTDGQRTK